MLGLLGNKPEFETTLVEAAVGTEAVARTSHCPMSILLRRPAQPTKSKEEGNKCRRSRYRKRKWPNWREAAEGQYNALLRPAAWVDLTEAENDIQRAGSASAQRSSTTRATPYDAFEFSLVAHRKQEKDPYRRKCLQRAMCAVRRHKKVWRVELRNMGRSEIPGPHSQGEHPRDHWQRVDGMKSGRLLQALERNHDARQGERHRD